MTSQPLDTGADLFLTTPPNDDQQRDTCAQEERNNAPPDAAENGDEPEAGQLALFDMEEPWKREWVGMPEFVQEDLTPWKSVMVHFATPGDLAAFAALIEQKMTPNTRSVWFPEAEIGRYANKRYADAA